jgi:hypothetical protein
MQPTNRYESHCAHSSLSARLPRIGPRSLFVIASDLQVCFRSDQRVLAIALRLLSSSAAAVRRANYFLLGGPDYPREPRGTGGRGRIRTSVARKERQIYSLLVLATHPPVLKNCPGDANYKFPPNRHDKLTESRNTKWTRVKRHQPVNFAFQDSLRLTPLQNFWWSWRRELNPRPSDYKSDALPAELRQRCET